MIVTSYDHFIVPRKKGKRLQIFTSWEYQKYRHTQCCLLKKTPSSSGTIKFENIESLFSRRFFHTYESVTNYSTRSCGATQLLKKRAAPPLGGDRNASIKWITHIHSHWNHNKAAQVVGISSCDFLKLYHYLVLWIIESANFHLYDYWNYYCTNFIMYVIIYRS